MPESEDLKPMTMFICGDGSQGCPKRPANIDHDWDGPVVERERGASVTCKFCGIEFETWALMHLP